MSNSENNKKAKINGAFSKRKEFRLEGKTHKWTAEEDNILFEFKTEGGNWQDISKELWDKELLRKTKDCVDKNRNLDKVDYIV